MRNKLLALLIFLVIGISVIFYQLNNISKVHPPIRVSNIPKNTVWAGGDDGGNWFQIKKVLPQNAFRIAIYNEWTGELMEDNIFTLDSSCTCKRMDSLTLIKSLCCYVGPFIELTLIENGKYCKLVKK